MSQGIKSDLSWRLPIWLQALASGGVILGCLFCPETPRWLISNDRHEEALRVMAEFHGEGDRNSPIVQLTYKEMVQEIATKGSDKRWWDYRDLFNSRNSWWRMCCVIGMAFFGQWAGNGAISYFMPVLLKAVGVENPKTQLVCPHAPIIRSPDLIIPIALQCHTKRHLLRYVHNRCPLH